jgi:hypothetical protein
MTKPLEKWKREMVVIDSLCRLPIEDGDQHNGGFNSLLTASGLVKGWKGRGYPPAAGVSLDYHLGQKLGTMLTPKFPFLSLGVQTSQFGEGLTFLGGGQRIFPHDGGNADPFKVYAKLFSSLVDPSKPAATPDPALVARLAVRGSVLDYVGKDVVAFQKRLGKEDRPRADAHLDAIRTLEKRLSTNLTGGAPGARCAPPAARATFSIDDPRNHREILRSQLDNIAAAFACDLTRVATIYIKHRFQNGANFEPINNAGLDVHGLSHDKPQEFVAARAAHNEDLSAFLDKLASIPEGTGTMLDNTIVFVCTECSHGHTNKVMPFLTIGGKNMGVRTGRYLVVPSRTPHKRLLTSFVKAMGLPDDDFGDRMGGFEDPIGTFKPIDLGTGPLPGYLAG